MPSDVTANKYVGRATPYGSRQRQAKELGCATGKGERETLATEMTRNLHFVLEKKAAGTPPYEQKREKNQASLFPNCTEEEL